MEISFQENPRRKLKRLEHMKGMRHMGKNKMYMGKEQRKERNS